MSPVVGRCRSIRAGSLVIRKVLKCLLTDSSATCDDSKTGGSASDGEAEGDAEGASMPELDSFKQHPFGADYVDEVGGGAEQGDDDDKVDTPLLMRKKLNYLSKRASPLEPGASTGLGGDAAGASLAGT